jgi:alcohol dehydrogenase
MLPAYFQFYNPVKILSGEKALENIPFELELLNARRPMIVTDKGVVQAGLINVLTAALGGSNLTIGAVYDRTPPDSSSLVVSEAAALFRDGACDSLIAVGGGSVLDTAKGINIVISEETTDLMKFIGADRLTKPMRPMIAVPTTAGTGSEVTLVAVIANEEKRFKMLFTSYLLLPRVAVLDPRMTLTMPPRITAATAMDALTHAVEAYSCLQKNPLSDAYAWAAIDLVRKYMITAVTDGKNEEARMALANAALMAGCAFSNSMVGLIHGIGHAVGGVSRVPHGMAMAILLPWGMEYNMGKCASHYGELLLPLAGPDEYLKTVPEKRADRSVAVVREMNARLHQLAGMPVTLKECGVKRESLPDIARTALGDGALVFNPEESDYSEILGILRKAY